MSEHRRRIWIDSFQTGLLLRIILYCVVYQLVAWAFFAICEAIDERICKMGVQGHFLSNHLLRSVLALLILIPPLTLDAVRFAHRLVGPLYRFRRTVQAIAAGEPVPLVKLRTGDFLTDFRDDFNAMLQHLEQQGFVLVKAPGTSETVPTPQPLAAVAPSTVTPDSCKV